MLTTGLVLACAACSHAGDPDRRKPDSRFPPLMAVIGFVSCIVAICRVNE